MTSTPTHAPDLVDLQLLFDGLNVTSAQAFLDEARGDSRRAEVLIAKERWSRLDPKKLKEFMTLADGDVVEAYRLYQERQKQDPHFLKTFCEVTSCTEETAKTFQARIVAEFGEEFRYNTERCIDWYLKFEDGDNVDRETLVKEGVTDKLDQLWLKRFRSLTGATLIVAKDYGKRWSFALVEMAVDEYWKDNDTKKPA